MNKLSALIAVALIAALAAGCGGQPPAGRGAEAPARTLPTAAAGKVLLATGEYPPYTSERMPQGGSLTAMVADVLREAGLEYELRFYPWARCEELVRTGEVWASFPYGFSEKTAQTYLMSAPLLPAQHRFFYAKANGALAAKAGTIKELADLRGHVVGGANGYWYGTRADLLALGLDRVEWADDVFGLVKMLGGGRLEVFAEDELVGWEAIRREFPGGESRFATMPHIAQARDYFLIVSKQYPRSEELLAKFNAALARLRQSGRLGQAAAGKN